MHRFAVTIAAATVFVGGSAIMRASVGAAPMAGAIRTAADSLNVVERAQFIWLGHNYCWYDDGWNGPGWYWCDQYLTPGIGWGGGYGWHHWRGGHPAAGWSSQRSGCPSHHSGCSSHRSGSHPGGGRPSGGGHRK